MMRTVHQETLALTSIKPVLLLLLLSAAGLHLAAVAPVLAQVRDWPGFDGQRRSLVRIEQAEVVIQQSDVLLASVHAEGVLSLPCAALEAPLVRREGSVFRILLQENAVPGDRFCNALSGMNAPFYLSLPLDLEGLSPGRYRVEINDMDLQFLIP